MALKTLLTISSTTTPALVTTGFNSDENVGDGQGWGIPSKTKIQIQAVRANGSAMTGVKFEVRGRQDTTSDWLVLPVYLITDTTQALAAEYSLSVSNNDTADTILVVPDAQGVLLIEVRAKAVGANAGVGDSANAKVNV